MSHEFCFFISCHVGKGCRLIQTILRAAFVLTCCLLAQAGFAKDMSFEMVYMNHTNMIIAEGDITGDTPEVFQAFLDTDPFDGFRFVIALDSNGGSLIGGLRLGQMIREGGFDTTVQRHPLDPTTGKPGYNTAGGRCFSACAIAFLGGVRRTVPEESRLGFHQFTSAGASLAKEDSVYLTESTAQLIGATVLGYIMTMGAEPDLFTRLSEALPHEMWEPDLDEQTALRIVTPDRFRDFVFEPYGAGVISWSALPENVVGRSVVGQVTAYCKARVPHILLSSINLEHSIDARTRKMIAEEQSGWRIDNETTGESASYSRKAVSIRMSDSLPLAELQLDARGVEMLKGGPVLIAVDFPAVIGAMFYLRTDPTEGDRAALDAAFRLCIQ